MIDRPTQVRKGEELDLKRLEVFLHTHLKDASGTLNVLQFPNGFSNLTYMIELGDKSFVLRRPPFGAKVKSGHDMGREYRILSGLVKAYPKVPQPIIYTEDEEIIGTPFYIMEKVEGVILRAKMPKEMIPEPAKMRKIAESLVDTFVELHEVDYESVGLGDIGRPEGYIQRQIEGWTRRYMAVKTDEIAEIEKVAKWLQDNMPKDNTKTLIHNDFKYDNLVLDSNDWTKIKTVLDWEMATIGHPLMDLGTSIGYWMNHNDPDFMKQMGLNPTTLPGNPTREEIVQHYAQKSGREVGDFVFYYVYGLFKIAVIVQQIYYRYKKGLTQDERFKNLNFVVQGCGNIAQRAIELQRLDNLF